MNVDKAIAQAEDYLVRNPYKVVSTNEDGSEVQWWWGSLESCENWMGSTEYLDVVENYHATPSIVPMTRIDALLEYGYGYELAHSDYYTDAKRLLDWANN